MVIVSTPIINKKNFMCLSCSIGKNRISKNTPAVTSVDEWTKAETGVGAAIAAGSHEEKGICALLVIAATTTKTIITEASHEFTSIKRKSKVPIDSMRPSTIKIALSPIRFLKQVSIPAA